MKIVKIFQLKIVFFTAVNNLCILHGRVFRNVIKRRIVLSVANKNCVVSKTCTHNLKKKTENYHIFN